MNKRNLLTLLLQYWGVFDVNLVAKLVDGFIQDCRQSISIP